LTTTSPSINQLIAMSDIQKLLPVAGLLGGAWAGYEFIPNAFGYTGGGLVSIFAAVMGGGYGMQAGQAIAKEQYESLVGIPIGLAAFWLGSTLLSGVISDGWIRFLASGVVGGVAMLLVLMVL
jgi:hypothetical protein